jgi:hypothetical protein
VLLAWCQRDRAPARCGCRRHEAARFCGEGKPIRYLGSLLFPADNLVLCVFEAPERDLVSDATARAHIPCERLMETVWLGSLEG